MPVPQIVIGGPFLCCSISRVLANPKSTSLAYLGLTESSTLCIIRTKSGGETERNENDTRDERWEKRENEEGG